MKNFALHTSLCLIGKLLLHGEPTPLGQALVEEKEITIECEITVAVPKSEVAVFESAKDGELAKGTYHYKLWLPKGYLADPQKRWPCFFIMSPGGKANMGPMAPKLKSSGYVIVMPQEAKNGPWSPIVGCMLASHDDVVKRVRIQEGLKFSTGFSGGARMASLLAGMRPGFSGVYLQGAGLPQKGAGYHSAGLTRIPGLAVAMAMGAKDSNFHEMKGVQATLPGVRFLPLSFDGGHQWAPADQFDKALTWLEQQVYVEAPARPEMKPVYVAYFKQRQAAWSAQTLPWERYRSGDALLALARARNLASDPAVSPALREIQTEVSRLRSDPAVAKEALAADTWHRLEESHRNVAPQKIAGDLRDFLKRYPGTEAAKKAEAKAAAP